MHPELDILVSSIGEVYLPQSGKNQAHWTFGYDTGKGYLRVGVGGKQYPVHRLVAETFIPNTKNKPTVDHKDRNRYNNSVDNLRWATHQEQAENTRSYNDCMSKYGVHESADPNGYARARRKATGCDRAWRQAHLERARKASRDCWRRKHWANYVG